MPRQIECDVAIIGGGPAGAATALALLQSGEHSVVVVDRSDLRHMRVGEQVSASIFQFLDYLGVPQSAFGEACFSPGYASRSFWSDSKVGQPRDAVFTSAGATYQIDRDTFDLTLLTETVERGGQVWPGTTCRAFRQTSQLDWLLDLSHPAEGPIELSARYLVDATGRQSNVSRYLGLGTRKHDQLMGLGVFISRDEEVEQLLEPVPLGWWYTAPLPGQRAAVVLFTDADLASEHRLHGAEEWQRQLQHTNHVARAVQGGIAEGKPWTRTAHTHLALPHSNPRFIQVGEAVAAFDPIASVGIGFALSTGCQAAGYIAAELDGEGCSQEVYHNDITVYFNEYQTLRHRYYAGSRQFEAEAFWQRRI